MAFVPLTNLKTPLPTFAPGGVSQVPVVRFNPRTQFSMPLPQFNPANANVTFAGQRPFIPIKPLPVGAGGGGGTVGYPI